MSLRPSIAINSFLIAERAALTARPALAKAGRFDRSAIMREAVRIARQFRVLRCWRRQMALGLVNAWKRAREALAAPPVPVAAPVLNFQQGRARSAAGSVRAWDLSSRVHSHGW